MVFSVDTKTIESHQQNYPSALPSLVCFWGPFIMSSVTFMNQADQGCRG